MSKKIFISALLSLTTLAGVLAPLTAEASQVVNVVKMITTSSKGVNVRDKNCQTIGVLPHHETVNSITNMDTITCNINGVEHKMRQVYDSPYISPKNSNFVSEKYLALLNLGPTAFTPTVKVTATAGLNLRDENCRRVGLLPYNTTVEAIKNTDKSLVCQVRNEYYLMQEIKIKGKSYYVAGIYLQNMFN